MDNEKNQKPDQSNQDETNEIREGQEESAIKDKDHIKHRSYPGTSLRDKQLDNQEEFITPPNQHPDEDAKK